MSAFLALLTSVVLVCSSAPQPDVAAAAEAFSNAQRAELARDFGRAAEFYELADSIAPSPEALRSAAKNRYAAGQPALAATLALSLLRRYGPDPESRELANRVLEETRPSLTRVALRCDAPCLVSVGGLAVADERALSHEFFVVPGRHPVAASFGDQRRDSQQIEARAGEDLELSFAQPPPPPSSAASLENRTPTDDDVTGRPLARLHPGYFVAATVLTAASAAVLIWSGTDVLAQNDAYTDDPSRARFDDGRTAERRTNVLIATTASLAVVTAVIAGFTDWSPGKRRRGKRERAVAQRGSGWGVRF